MPFDRSILSVKNKPSIWQGHAPEQVKVMKEGLAKLAEQGMEAIEDESL